MNRRKREKRKRTNDSWARCRKKGSKAGRVMETVEDDDVMLD